MCLFFFHHEKRDSSRCIFAQMHLQQSIPFSSPLLRVLRQRYPSCKIFRQQPTASSRGSPSSHLLSCAVGTFAWIPSQQGATNCDGTHLRPVLGLFFCSCALVHVRFRLLERNRELPCPLCTTSSTPVATSASTLQCSSRSSGWRRDRYFRPPSGLFRGPPALPAER